MRPIRLAPAIAFIALLCLVCGLTGATLQLGAVTLASAGVNSAAAWVAGAVLIHAYAMLVHRLFLLALPLQHGEIGAGTQQEFVYQVYLLFYLILFNTLTRSSVLPIPLMRLVYLALGARLGRNSYSSGIICDPIFVRIGANCMIGEGSLLVPHLIEGSKLAHFAILIGDNVTIGAHAVILGGVSIGDNAMVAANSVVTKGVRIGPGETWGGSPARRIDDCTPPGREDLLLQRIA